MKKFCAEKEILGHQHILSLPRIELSKNETEKIKYLRFIEKESTADLSSSWIYFLPRALWINIS